MDLGAFYFSVDLISSARMEIRFICHALMLTTKSSGAKKKQLHIEKGDDDFIPGQGGAFDDPDDYDFM